MGTEGSEGCVDEECGQLVRALMDQPRTFTAGMNGFVEVGRSMIMASERWKAVCGVKGLRMRRAWRGK